MQQIQFNTAHCTVQCKRPLCISAVKYCVHDKNLYCHATWQRSAKEYSVEQSQNTILWHRNMAASYLQQFWMYWCQVHCITVNYMCYYVPRYCILVHYILLLCPYYSGVQQSASCSDLLGMRGQQPSGSYPTLSTNLANSIRWLHIYLHGFSRIRVGMRWFH